MSDSIKVILAIILVVLVIVLCVTTLTSNNEIADNSSNNVLDTENTDIDEKVVNENNNNTDIENKNEVEENIQTKNIIENEIILDTMVNSNTQNNVYESQTDIGSTDKKQQAINLVKEKWGDDDTVTFRCDNISDGEYIVAVVSIQTASVQNYFRVNLENQTVTIDY